MPTLPVFIPALVVITTLYAARQFSLASGNQAVMMLLIVWLMLHSVLSFTGFYTVTDTMPPRLVLLAGPPVLAIAVLFATSKGRQFIDRFDIGALTLLHTVRIPVEIVLYMLLTYQAVPKLMTFEGWNLDILPE